MAGVVSLTFGAPGGDNSSGFELASGFGRLRLYGRTSGTAPATVVNLRIDLMAPVDQDLRTMMRELGHALVHAIAASPSAADTVRGIRQLGYSLCLVLGRDAGDSGTRIELTSSQVLETQPGFLLNKGDVSFLESVGIDATRSGRRRRAP